jgi:hypothetical protein
MLQYFYDTQKTLSEGCLPTAVDTIYSAALKRYTVQCDIYRVSREYVPSEFKETLSESIQKITDRQISNDTAESSLIYQNIPSGFMVELPFEFRISICGRKLKRTDYTCVIYIVYISSARDNPANLCKKPFL